MSNAEYAVLVAALRLQLGANWGGEQPCEYWEGEPPPAGQFHVATPSGRAVYFRVLGRVFCDLGYEFRAREIAALLERHGVWTRPSTPNSDRRTVKAAF